MLEGLCIEDQQRDTLISVARFKASINKIDLDNNVLYLNRIILDDAYINLIKFRRGGDFNFQFIADAFSGEKTPKDSTQKDFKVFCNNISLVSTNFHYSLLYKKHIKWGIDYDYLRFNDINADLDNFALRNDTIYVHVHKMSLWERCGLKINNLEANIKAHETILELKNLKTTTPESYINGDIQFLTESWDDYNDLTEKVVLRGSIYESKLQMGEIAFFAPEINGMRKQVSLKGDIFGKINDFTARNVELQFGDATVIKGKLKMVGLPYINETTINLKIKELVTNKKDIESIPLPPFEGKDHIELPDNFASLGEIRYKGDYIGFYNNFVTYGEFKCALGNAKTDIKINYNLDTEISEYSGKVNTSNFNLAKLLNNSNLGSIALNGEVDGRGFTMATVNTKFKGNISSIDVNNYNYKNVDVDGRIAKRIFQGKCNINDENVKLDFDGSVDFNKKFPELAFNSNIEKIHPRKLGLYPFETFDWISGSINTELKGDDINNAEGQVLINNLQFIDDNNCNKYIFGDASLSSVNNQGEHRIVLTSAIADARIVGNYHLEDLGTATINLLHAYLPNIVDKSTSADSKKVQDFEFAVKLKNSESLTKVFLPDYKFSDGTFLSGSFNSESNLLEAELSSNESSINKVNVQDYLINVSTIGNVLKVNSNYKKINFSDSLWMGDVKFNAQTATEKIDFDFGWKNKQYINNSGDISGALNVLPNDKFEFYLNRGNVYLRDSAWTLSTSEKVLVDTTAINIKGLHFVSNHQKIDISGLITENKEDVLKINFSKFNLASFNPLLKESDIELNGHVNGPLELSNLYHKMVSNAKLTLDKFVINKEELGDGVISSEWNQSTRAMKANGSFYRGLIPTIQFNGAYYPFADINNFDFNIHLQRTQLKLIDQFVVGILSDFKGFATGDMKLQGTPHYPILTGVLDIEKAGFQVDYLKTNYTFSHELIIKENVFEMVDATMFDDNGNPAIASFRMYHSYFKDFRFDINFKLDKTVLLNTTLRDNNLFYGKALASGEVNIYGPVDNITMDINMKTEKGTTLFIPYDETEEVAENSFLTFVKKGNQTEIKSTKKKIDLSGIQMNFDLELTPDAQIQMVFDSKAGDVIKGKGNGNIKMDINTNGAFNMFGNYTFTEGDYLFTFENAINKKFRIESGSSISWSGDPYNANMNVTAIYRTKTSVQTLLNDTTTEEYKRSMPVNVKLKMMDKLFSPTIGFGIDFPTQQNNEQLKASVNAVIGNENVQELNRQVFALLMIGSFLPPAGSSPGATRIGEGLGNSTSELLSSQFNNWLSQIVSSQFNFGVNYKSGAFTSQQVELAVSTQLFNNRLSIDGNFGVTTQSQSTAASNLVDVNVEYKLTDDGKLRVMAYNRPNDYISSILQSSNNKQGLGILYREEFNTLNELWKRYTKAFRKKKEKKS